MKTLKYTGFDGKECSCHYVIGNLDGKVALIFKQIDLAYTSITNIIENITSLVLRTDLRGVDPARLRVFEFYPAHLKPLTEWQEVAFKGIYAKEPERTLIQKLVAAFAKMPTDHYWIVDRPYWGAVDSSLRKQLAGIHPALK